MSKTTTIHLASDDESTTMCGRKLAALTVSDGADNDVTCKTCIAANEAEGR